MHAHIFKRCPTTRNLFVCNKSLIIYINYPFWLVRDWYFLYDQWLMSYFSGMPMLIHWDNLPSLYFNKEDRIQTNISEIVGDIVEGMPSFLEYIHSQNKLFGESGTYSCEINAEYITNLYVSYIVNNYQQVE